MTLSMDKRTRHISNKTRSLRLQLLLFRGMAVCMLLSHSVAFAQRPDTLSCSYDHSFRLSEIAAPVALVGTGAVITAVPTLHTNIDGGIRQWSQCNGHAEFPIDNYIQYLPLAAVPTLKLCGVESRHGWRDLACLEAGSCLMAFVINTGFKHSTSVRRPYGDVFNSFPSGHTVTAFVGAELLRREYGRDYPGIAIAGYAFATGVGCMRIYNDKHWFSDVLAGAGIGILSASIMYWLAPYLRF